MTSRLLMSRQTPVSFQEPSWNSCNMEDLLQAFSYLYGHLSLVYASYLLFHSNRCRKLSLAHATSSPFTCRSEP